MQAQVLIQETKSRIRADQVTRDFCMSRARGMTEDTPETVAQLVSTARKLNRRIIDNLRFVRGMES